MANRGAWAIGAMFTVGLLLAAGSVVYHYQKGRRALEFWGAADAALIRHAPDVELLELTPSAAAAASADSTPASSEPPSELERASAADERLDIDGASFRVVRKKAIGKARGFVHARHALIIDGNYDWQNTPAPPTSSPAPRWSHALVFRREGRQVTLAFDFDQALIRRLDPPRAGTLQPTIAAAEKAIMLRELPPLESPN